MQTDATVALGSAGFGFDWSTGLNGVLEHIHRLNRIGISSVQLHSN